MHLENLVRAALLRAGNITRDHHVTVELDSSVRDISVEPAAITEVIYMLLDHPKRLLLLPVVAP